ncbi:MAG TPA: PucR family transcriptional regulator ligand-binding domain-containing protein [Bacillus sp. (in: firmicutes)]|nr:PucR family transcriptional regulator ligand-binding domain-containing protein [Bacillus sp. (in: firmicutes)]
MRLNELLDLPVFKGTTLLAGEQSVEREVNTVNMMDAPDIIHFLKKNELLITTAFHFKDDLDSLLQLIKEMAKHSCSGLGIKTKRFLREIPEAAITLANELHFPLLELPVHTSLGDIVNKSLSYILDRRTNELHHAMQVHQQFTNQIMNGKGIDKILDNLSSIIHFPVVLLNYHLQPAAKHVQHSSVFKSLEALIADGLHFHLPNTTMSAFSLINENRETVTLFPIYTHKQYNYMCVFGFIPLSDRSTILTIKQASNVIAFELMKENALKQNARRIQNEFFHNFINGTFTTAEEVVSRGKEFGLLNDTRYVCAVGEIEDQEQHISFAQHQSEQELICDTIELELQRYHQRVHLFTLNHTYILLMQPGDGWKDIDETFVSFLQEIQTKISTHFQKDLSFGISNYAQQLIHIPVSYKEATDTLYYGHLSGKKRFIELYQPKEVPEILRMVPYDQLKKFYTDAFQAFANEPKKDHQTLLHTLSVYLETHCQLSETANRLYVHRNTVIYRLEKCEEIIGRSLKEPDETLRLRLAFRIKALLQGNSQLD